MAIVGEQETNRRFVLGVSILSFLVAMIFLPLPSIQRQENRFYDGCFALVHLFHAHPRNAPEIGFVSIDDKSVDPSYSKFSCEWGREGWVTRFLWNRQLQSMLQYYKPKVLAFDILLQRLSVSSLPLIDSDSQIARTVEAKGDKEFLNILCNYDDARQQGDKPPYPVFAYEFPDDESILQRGEEDQASGVKPSTAGVVPLTPTQQALADQQKYWFKKLDKFRLPAGSVLRGGYPPIHQAVRLPMDEILKAPFYFLGAINDTSDADGIFRRAPLLFAYRPPGETEVRYVPSFALQAFLLSRDIIPKSLKPPGQGVPSIRANPGHLLTITDATNKTWTIPIDKQLRTTLAPRFLYGDLAAPVNGNPVGSRFSFGDLLRVVPDEENPEAVSDNRLVNTFKADVKRISGNGGMILIVGQAFTGGTDVGNFQLEHEVPRAILHLQVLNNIIEHDHNHLPGWWVKALICLALAAAMAGLHGWTYGRAPGIGSVLLIFAYVIVVTAVAMGFNLQLPLLVPLGLMIACFGIDSYQHYLTVRQAREVMRRQFARVTSDRILSLLEENPEALNVHRKTSATMLFSDVEGFTSLSEKLDPEYLATLINRYLSPMTEIIVQNDGYLDKYSGDGIMAIWGVPLPDKDHAYKACIAAWRQIETANALVEILPNGRPYRFRVRVGVNTGLVSAGNMGSNQKSQYTVMGDEVNLSARLEPTNKDYGTQLIIGPVTYSDAKDRIYARRLDKIIVKGRTEAVLIYELLGIVGETPPPGDWLVVYEEGMDHLWARRWDEAEHCFAQAIRLRHGDSPSELQRSRIVGYRETPPPADWQGEYTRLKKD